jgi:hypothetical protein
MEKTLIDKNISQLSKNDLLQRSEKFIFSTGLDDAASKLCKLNMRYGLAQMHLIQEKYGFEPRAFFISSPDETVSRNKYRWNSGYGYGGKISWGSGNEKLIFLNTKPNHCGILVGGLWKEPNPYDLIKNMNAIKSKELYLDDILIDWDFAKSNHFISCYKSKMKCDIEFPPYIFLIHGSAPELRGDEYGMGIYIDQSKKLHDIAIEENTPLGKQYILLDSEAEEYMRLNMKAVEFSNNKRELIARDLFQDNYEIISNQPHQFLKDYNSIHLGCNCTDLKTGFIDSNIFPIGLRADLPAYLFEGAENLSEKVLKKLGFFKRARSLGLIEELKEANIIPHGAGYAFPDIKDVVDVLEFEEQRYFVCRLVKGKNRLKIVRVVSDLQFEYRKNKIIEKTIKLRLGKMAAKLKPIFSLKA